MARRGSPWVGWSWLAMGGSVGFDGLAGLDSMVVVCGSVVGLGMNLNGFGYESHG